MVELPNGAQDESIAMQGAGGGTVGQVIRARRKALGLTLERLSRLVGCTKSYLSTIENDRRARPPGDEVLARIESALGMERGSLVATARWQSTPAMVRREVQRLDTQRRAARRLAELLAEGGIEPDGRVRGALDEAFRSGELRRLVERLVRPEPPAGGAVPVPLPMEIPLINKVSAGYPREFTDLGYPARVADEYVRAPDLDDPDAFAARVVGDSMEPEYREGDVVVFSPARPVRSGMDCFARIEPDHETTFKRVYFEQDASGRELIRLQPLNSAYAPRLLPREQVAGLYAAVSVIRRLDQWHPGHRARAGPEERI